MLPLVYYVVNTENGWDNVIGIFDNKEEAEKLLKYMDSECCRLRSAPLESKFIE